MILLLVSCLSLIACCQASVWDNLNATIAVVEYAPVLTEGSTDKELVLENVLEYSIEMAAALQNAGKLDMIVFPESALLDERDTSSEVKIDTTCDSSECDQPIETLSKLAKIARSYVIVNLIERAECDDSTRNSSNCEKFNNTFYNTDVVFDRNGTIVSKYRKYNLFGEYTKDKPNTVDEGIFETDFGVSFGIFTCFDILFKSPAQDLVGRVDAVVFPTMWFSELPFLTAIQTQQMWSQAHDIHFFSAGANNPRVGSGGTGVFDGKAGMITGGIIGGGGSQTYIYKVENGSVDPPSKRKTLDDLSKEMDNFYLKRDPSIDHYKSEILAQSVTNKEICYDDSFCCSFTVTMATINPTDASYVYRLVAYSGERTFDGVYFGGIDICGVIACPTSELSSCGKRFPKYEDVNWAVNFTDIIIVANFPNNENRTQFPNSLLSSILPIGANETIWSYKNVTVDGKPFVQRTFSTSNQKNLLTFAIFGRNFELDHPPNTTDPNSGSSTEINYLVLTIFLLITIFESLI